MKLKTARQCWHDAFFTGQENTIDQYFKLGVPIQKTIKSNSTDASIHAWLAGRVQHAISTLPPNIAGFGHFMYSPMRTIDDLEAGQEAVYDYFRYNYKGERLTDKKSGQASYLAIAAMYEYSFTIYKNPSPFISASAMCKWLYDFKGIKINPEHWTRDWWFIYEELLNACDYIDKIALKPVSDVIKKCSYKEVA